MTSIELAGTDVESGSVRPEAWIWRRPEVSVAADVLAARAGGGPLAGLRLAVKNNVDVAGVPTTAGCPGFADGPATHDAPAVARLQAAGAVVVGATNLDQFATGLVGQRSPYGAVRAAHRPTHVSGGSSSGSAVAVATGEADLGIGTDTAGSGRVPAAFNGIVGIKPTLGTVSTEGVVPACRSYDAVTLFARDLPTAAAGMAAMAGGPGTRRWPSDAPLAAPEVARVAVPDRLVAMAPGWAEAFDAAAQRLRADGCVVEPIPFEEFLEAARLLYDGGLVAERHAAVGDFVDAHLTDPDAGLDPTVAGIIHRAGEVSGPRLARDQATLAGLRARCLAHLDGFDALLVPTAPFQPTRQEVADDPLGPNARVGTYTNFCNLFDLSAVAVPSGTVDEGAAGVAPFGVTVVARAFHDMVALDLASRVCLPVAPPEETFAGAPAGAAASGVPWPAAIADVATSGGSGVEAVDLFVVGAHLRGQPLEGQLRDLGALWAGEATTTPAYALTALDTTPSKPGMTRVGAGGAAVAGEVWRLTPGALGRFLAALPEPMSLGRVELADGRWVVGFGAAADAVARGRDITVWGGWRTWLASR